SAFRDSWWDASSRCRRSASHCFSRAFGATIFSPFYIQESEAPTMISLTINGKDQSVDAEPNTLLLWVIRDTVGLTGTKFGCGMQLCGACTVHLDGQPVRSCGTPVSAAVGKKIT